MKGPLPRAPSRKAGGGGDAGGGRFSKRSASPGPPPEEWLGFELSLSANNMPLLVGERGSMRVLWSQQLAEPPQTYSVWKITNFYYK